MTVSTTIESKRLMLRKVQLDDWSVLFHTVSHPLFPENLPLKERILTRKDARSFIGQCIKAWTTHTQFTWSICLKKDIKIVVGQISLTKQIKPNAWAVAFWISPDHQRLGYAREAVYQLTEFSRQKNDSIEFWAGAATWNTGSNKVLKNSGFTFLHPKADGYICHDRQIPINVYIK